MCSSFLTTGVYALQHAKPSKGCCCEGCSLVMHITLSMKGRTMRREAVTAMEATAITDAAGS